MSIKSGFKRKAVISELDRAGSSLDDFSARFNSIISRKPSFTNVLTIFAIPDDAGGGVLAAPREPDAAAPGEMGRPVILPTNMSAQTKKLVDDGWLNNAFNQYASDLISVHRSLPDPRDQW